MADGESQAEARRLGEAMIVGDAADVLERCRGDEKLTRSVSLAAAEALAAHSSSQVAARPPAEATWTTSQGAVLELAGLAGADQQALANALFDACVCEHVSGDGSDLDAKTLRWLLKQVPERAELLVDGDADPSIDPRHEQPFGLGIRPEPRFVFNALFCLPGADGVYWMNRMRQREWGEHEVNSMYQAMCSGRLSYWAPDNWIARLEALAERRVEPRPEILGVFGITTPPVASSASQVRLACVYADDPTDYLLRTVVRNLRTYRQQEIVDETSLFAWDVPADRRPLLRWILELSGPPGTRAALVAAAHAQDQIDETTADELTAELDRPAWADREVPWKVVEVLDAGTVRVPDGRLAGGDPWWSFEGLPFEVQVRPGSYRVRVVLAEHPLYRPANAAAEIVIDPDTRVSTWRLVETTDHRDGYVAEVGVGSFGAAETLCPGLNEALPNDVIRNDPTSVEFDAGDAGSLVMFSVRPQHQRCRTWEGRDSAGSLVRLLTDLGLLELDPTEKAPVWLTE